MTQINLVTSPWPAQVIRIQPGDLIVLQVPKDADTMSMEAVAKVLSNVLGDNCKVIAVKGEITLRNFPRGWVPTGVSG